MKLNQVSSHLLSRKLEKCSDNLASSVSALYFYFNPIEIERNQDETISFFNSIEVAGRFAVPSNSEILL